MASFVSGVRRTCTTTSLMVSETNTDDVSRLYLLKGPTVLIPSPGITRSRRAGGTLTLTSHRTTLCMGSTRTIRRLLPLTIRAIGSRGQLRSLNQGTDTVTFASSTGHVTRRICGLTMTCEGGRDGKVRWSGNHLFHKCQ